MFKTTHNLKSQYNSKKNQQFVDESFPMVIKGRNTPELGACNDIGIL
jgi:hypothetical protein